jgi:hypothetical protein
MTAAAGGIDDADKGWRVAVRYALEDVAQNGLMKPRRLAVKEGQGEQMDCRLPTIPQPRSEDHAPLPGPVTAVD